MGDVLEGTGRDDAPLTTSKDKDRAEEAGVIAPKGGGESLSGKTVTITRPRQALYDYWRDFSNLPSFMDNVVPVELLDEARSRSGEGARRAHRGMDVDSYRGRAGRDHRLDIGRRCRCPQQRAHRLQRCCRRARQLGDGDDPL